jgi:hypothetical protein
MGRLSLAGHGDDNGMDDDADENGIDSATPPQNPKTPFAFALEIIYMIYRAHCF